VANDLSADGRGVLLARIAAACLERLPVDDVTVALATGPMDWAPAHATGPVVGRLEEFAFATGEGPCLDVLRDHAPTLVPDLTGRAAAMRWPIWSTAARDAGIRAVFAFPIHAGAIAAGVLTMYSRTLVTFGQDEMPIALRLADEAFVGLLDLTSGTITADENGQPSPELDRDLLRSEVHQASGMVMAQTGLRIDAALARLRAHAFVSERPLSEIASDVIARRLRFEPDQKSAE
jgi:hypothetical protein